MKSHKQWVSETFDRAAEKYGRDGASYFSYFGKRLTEQVDLKKGQHVLDVATGRGAVLFPAAEKVGAEGKVIGIDISGGMVRETAREVEQKGLRQAELRCMDAEQLDFPDQSFDVVFCGFALFFLPSAKKALHEFKRVLRPGGKLAVSIWGEDSDLDQWVDRELQKLDIGSGLIATPLGTGDDLKKLLEKGGFRLVEVADETKTFKYQTAEEWWGTLWNVSTRAKLEKLSQNQLVSLQQRGLIEAERLRLNGEELCETFRVFYATAMV